MFFPERIRSIKSSDRVLEIGPGSSPHPRANVLLERTFDDDEAFRQRGGTGLLKTAKTLVYYDGRHFPFDDDTFDYVICSHVIEHIDDIELFCSEMFRIAKKGYLEYPTIYYEYLFNFSVHKQLINFSEGELRFLPKIETGLQYFQSVHSMFNRALEMGYSDIVDDMKAEMFQGFEWSTPFTLRKAAGIDELKLKKTTEIPKLSYVSRILRRIIRKIL